MSTRINTNSTAFDASINLSKNTVNESTDIQRLSSGLRINSAADDPSGYVLSQSLQAQSGSLTQATSNTNDAINVVKTAEGALSQVQSLLNNIRQTIVQAANVGSNNATALAADAKAVANSVASIDRIAGTTQFNGKNLLDGSASAGGVAIKSGVGSVVATNSQVATLAVANDAIRYGATALSGAAVTYNAAKSATYTIGSNGSTFNGSLKINGITINLTVESTLDQINAALAAAGSTYSAGTSNGALVFTDSQTVQSAGAAAFDASGLQYATSGIYQSVPTGILDDGNPASVTVTKTDAFGVTTAYTSDKLTVGSDGTSMYGFSTGVLTGLQLTSNATAAALPVTAGVGIVSSSGSLNLAKVADAKSYGLTGVYDYVTYTQHDSTITSTSAVGSSDTFGGSLVVNGQTVTLAAGNANSLSALNTAIQATTGNAHIVASVNGSSQLVLTDATGTTISANTNSLQNYTDNGAIGAFALSGSYVQTSANNVALTDLLSGTLTLAGSAVTLTIPGGESLSQLQTDIRAISGGAFSSATVAITSGKLTITNGTTFTATSTLHNLTPDNPSGIAAPTASTDGVSPYITINGQNSISSAISGPNTVFSFAGGALSGLQISAATSALATIENIGGIIGSFSATPDILPANIGLLSATADTVTAGNALQFQIGSNQNQITSLSLRSTKSTDVGAYTDAVTAKAYKLSDLLRGGGLDLTDVTGKSQQDALAVIDQAIKDVTMASESLGSTQTNVLQSNINSLATAQSNNDASLSTVRDTDLAATVVDFTKNQILVSAGTSALSYANQAPQAILKLLQ